MLSAGWYDGKGAKETVVVVGCVKRVWVVVACGFLPTNAEVACRLIRWNSADMGRLGAGDDDSEFRSSVDMEESEVEKGVGRQGCGIIVTLSTFLKDDNIWEGSGSKRSVSSAAETSDVNSAMENGGGDGERFVVVVVAVDILLNNSGRVKNDDNFFSLPI